MSGCSLCSGTIEHFHGQKKHLTLSQRLYIFANRNKQSISICTIAIIVAIYFILKNKK